MSELVEDCGWVATSHPQQATFLPLEKFLMSTVSHVFADWKKISDDIGRNWKLLAMPSQSLDRSVMEEDGVNHPPNQKCNKNFRRRNPKAPARRKKAHLIQNDFLDCDFSPTGCVIS
jgi:hypothetical protein